MVEAVVFDLADSIIGKFSSLILPETEPWWIVKDDLDDLKNTVSAIKAILLDAGERSATSNFTAWLKNLKDALCDTGNLLEELSSEVWKENPSHSGCLSNIAFHEMCARIQALKKRLNSLESEFKIPFMAGTRQQGHLFVNKDEEQSVTDYSFQVRLKLQIDLENMPVYSFSEALQTCYGMAEFEHQSLSNGSKRRNLNCFLNYFIEPEQHWGESFAQTIPIFYADPTERGINNNDKITFWEKVAEIMKNEELNLELQRVMETKYVLKVTKIGKTKASQQAFYHLNQLKKQWPMQSDLQEIDRKYKDAVLVEAEAKWLLLLIGEKIEKLDRQRPEDLDEKFFLPPQWKVKVTANDDLTREGVQSKFCDLENQLYDKGNDKVECNDFPGLEQALKNTTWGKIPDYLEPIAIQIEKDRGKTTDVFHIPIQVLVCAAIKEMKDFSVGDLDWSTLKKWSATLNYAKKYGFQVEFADNLLKKNLLAYFAIQNLPNSTAKV